MNGCPKRREYVNTCKSFVLHLDSEDSEQERTVIKTIEENVKLVEKDCIYGVLKRLTPYMESRNIVLKVAFCDYVGPDETKEEFENALKRNHSKLYDAISEHIDSVWAGTKCITNCVFGVFFLDHFGEYDSEMKLISGVALENYIRNAAKKKQKTYLFDETYKQHKLEDFSRLFGKLEGKVNKSESPHAFVNNETKNPMEKSNTDMEDDNEWYDTYDGLEESLDM